MEMRDFIDITKTHIYTVEKIVEMEGTCDGIYCTDCPFNIGNSNLDKQCGELYSNDRYDECTPDGKLLNSAIEFLRMIHIKMGDKEVCKTHIVENPLESAKKWLEERNITECHMFREKGYDVTYEINKEDSNCVDVIRKIFINVFNNNGEWYSTEAVTFMK